MLVHGKGKQRLPPHPLPQFNSLLLLCLYSDSLFSLSLALLLFRLLYRPFRWLLITFSLLQQSQISPLPPCLRPCNLHFFSVVHHPLPSQLARMALWLPAVMALQSWQRLYLFLASFVSIVDLSSSFVFRMHFLFFNYFICFHPSSIIFLSPLLLPLCPRLSFPSSFPTPSPSPSFPVPPPSGATAFPASRYWAHRGPR